MLDERHLVSSALRLHANETPLRPGPAPVGLGRIAGLPDRGGHWRLVLHNNALRVVGAHFGLHRLRSRTNRPGRDVRTAVRDGNRNRKGKRVGRPEVQRPNQQWELSGRVRLRAVGKGGAAVAVVVAPHPHLHRPVRRKGHFAVAIRTPVEAGKRLLEGPEVVLPCVDDPVALVLVRAALKLVECGVLERRDARAVRHFRHVGRAEPVLHEVRPHDKRLLLRPAVLVAGPLDPIERHLRLAVVPDIRREVLAVRNGVCVGLRRGGSATAPEGEPEEKKGAR